MSGYSIDYARIDSLTKKSDFLLHVKFIRKDTTNLSKNNSIFTIEDIIGLNTPCNVSGLDQTTDCSLNMFEEISLPLSKSIDSTLLASCSHYFLIFIRANPDKTFSLSDKQSLYQFDFNLKTYCANQKWYLNENGIKILTKRKTTKIDKSNFIRDKWVNIIEIKSYSETGQLMFISYHKTRSKLQTKSTGFESKIHRDIKIKKYYFKKYNTQGVLTEKENYLRAKKITVNKKYDNDRIVKVHETKGFAPTPNSMLCLMLKNDTTE